MVEIESALLNIHNDKALGVNGMNVLFYKKLWSIAKNDLCNAVMFYFDSSVMFGPINVTSLTLVPKVSNASYVKQFRPIACCIVMYKIIAKVLANRL